VTVVLPSRRSVRLGAYDSAMPENGDERSRGPRCTALTKRGERCRALAGTDGLCSAHRDPGRMRELGKLSGQARSRPKAERVPPSLREYLRAEVPPAEVWRALKTALEGNSEAARVSASKVLMDALSEHGTEQDWRKQMASEIETAARRFDARITGLTERTRLIRREKLAGILEPLGLEELADEEDELELVRQLAGRLAAIPEEIRADHSVS
jgi:hypothetical protein